MLRLCSMFMLSVCSALAFFTLPGKCPENVELQEDFRLANFYGVWHQVQHYSSDGRHQNNCSALHLVTSSGIHVNMSRVDRGHVGRYSLAKIEIPVDVEDSARMNITFVNPNAPRRLVTRRYPFWVLAFKDRFATVYTCQYSPLINKHYVYVWVLSRTKLLNAVSLQLALQPARAQLGLAPQHFLQDDLSEDRCAVRRFEYSAVEPTAFRFPVPV